jgi:hypothetical protein
MHVACTLNREYLQYLLYPLHQTGIKLKIKAIVTKPAEAKVQSPLPCKYLHPRVKNHAQFCKSGVVWWRYRGDIADIF